MSKTLIVVVSIALMAIVAVEGLAPPMEKKYYRYQVDLDKKQLLSPMSAVLEQQTNCRLLTNNRNHLFCAAGSEIYNFSKASLVKTKILDFGSSPVLEISAIDEWLFVATPEGIHRHNLVNSSYLFTPINTQGFKIFRGDALDLTHFAYTNGLGTDMFVVDMLTGVSKKYWAPVQACSRITAMAASSVSKVIALGCTCFNDQATCAVAGRDIARMVLEFRSWSNLTTSQFKPAGYVIDSMSVSEEMSRGTISALSSQGGFWTGELEDRLRWSNWDKLSDVTTDVWVERAGLIAVSYSHRLVTISEAGSQLLLPSQWSATADLVSCDSDSSFIVASNTGRWARAVKTSATEWAFKELPQPPEAKQGWHATAISAVDDQFAYLVSSQGQVHFFDLIHGTSSLVTYSLPTDNSVSGVALDVSTFAFVFSGNHMVTVMGLDNTTAWPLPEWCVTAKMMAYSRQEGRFAFLCTSAVPGESIVFASTLQDLLTPSIIKTTVGTFNTPSSLVYHSNVVLVSDETGVYASRPGESAAFEKWLPYILPNLSTLPGFDPTILY